MAESQESVNDISSIGWKRPDEFMKLHLLKKKRALNARLCKKVLPTPTTTDTTRRDVFQKRDLFQKRKNPFRCETDKRFKGGENACEISSSELENSNDTTLFQLITASSASENQQNNEGLRTSFASILSKLKGETTDPIVQNENNYIPVDWSLKSKIRLMSEKPFPWNLKLKTCEEASGITGFVRCVNSGLSPEKNSSTTCSLDTSPNARFHQCCLVWQYPSFPWLSVFPRTAGRVSSTSASFFGSNPELRDSLYHEWLESFRSLFQLVRALQCPYFYVCANSFTCLFRAAGISGKTDIHAFVTPTTTGFRQLLKSEDVEYTMPLRKSKPAKRLSNDSNSDTGYDTLDSITEEQTQSSFSKASAVNEFDEDDDDDDDETADEWLKSMGMEASEIKKLNAQQEKLVSDRSREIDQSPESLIYVEGVEVQALFNFLLNCKSTISPTGPLAGIPPTLLAPVAFRGAHLKPFKVQQSRVKVDTQSYYSIEIRGPILPHTVHNLCGLIKQTQSFSMTFAHVESTKPFSEVATAIGLEKEIVDTAVKTPEKIGNSGTAHTPSKTPASDALSKENLSDCGLHRSLIDSFCSPDVLCIRVVDSLRSNIDGTYSWS